MEALRVARAFRESGLLGRDGTAALSVELGAVVVVVEVGTAAEFMLVAAGFATGNPRVPELLAPPLACSHGLGGEGMLRCFCVRAGARASNPSLSLLSHDIAFHRSPVTCSTHSFRGSKFSNLPATPSYAPILARSTLTVQ